MEWKTRPKDEFQNIRSIVLNNKKLTYGWIDSQYTNNLASIIIPTYNRSSLLIEALNSTINQTYRPIEVIIVEDGSKISAKRLVKNWVSSNAKYQQNFEVCFIRKERGGLPSARNRGLLASRGEFIQFLDDDDILFPNKLSVLVDALNKKPDAGYAWCIVKQTYLNGEEIARVGQPISSGRSTDFICHHNWHTCGPIFRRKVCEAVGRFAEDLKISVDWEYAARVKALCGEGVFIDSVLAEYRIHNGQQMINLSGFSYAKKREHAIDKVRHLLDDLSIESKKSRNLCALQLIYLALLFGSANTKSDYLRCLKKSETIKNNHYTLLSRLLIICGRAFSPRILADIIRFLIRK